MGESSENKEPNPPSRELFPTRKDPGATKLGNFVNYYQFHPPEDRITFLPPHIWLGNQKRQIVCLDIGCNSGDLTQQVFEYLRRNFQETTNQRRTDNKCCVLGIDIDPNLIYRAKISNRHETFVSYETLDIMSGGANITLNEYLRTQGVERFTAIFCFSVTMWIHLNHGDEGLKTFLSNLCKITDVLIIEPQPWKCYLSAVRRLRKNNESFPKINELRMNKRVDSNIEDIIHKKHKMHKIYESNPNSWGRKILIFRKSAL